jgi:hypothetical protein
MSETLNPCREAFNDWYVKNVHDNVGPLQGMTANLLWVGWGAGWNAKPAPSEILVIDEESIKEKLFYSAISTTKNISGDKVITIALYKIMEIVRPYFTPKREICPLPLPAIGDYCLATKYSDGDPGDAWGVGYYDGVKYGDRHMIKDATGAQIRLNGFRRVAKISSEYGNWLMSNAAMLEKSPPGMINLWGMLNPIEIEVLKGDDA